MRACMRIHMSACVRVSACLLACVRAFWNWVVSFMVALPPIRWKIVGGGIVTSVPNDAIKSNIRDSCATADKGAGNTSALLVLLKGSLAPSM